MGKTNLQDRVILETNLDNPTSEETLEQQAVVDNYFNQQRAEKILADEENVQYWKNIAKLILPRFQSGMSEGNMSYRLKRARKLGFHVESETGKMVSKMTEDELRSYYIHEVMPAVYEGAGKYCPKLVSRINAWNQERQTERGKPWMLR